MKTIWLGVALVAIFSLCGCLDKHRTPYNELSLFAGDEQKEGRKTLNLWPLYLSDGRARYVAWPLIKSSPGCFAFLPFYNYDHGIHDVCLLATAVPEEGVYRFLPLFYRDPERCFLLPFFYVGEESWGSPLLFNAVDFGPFQFTNLLNVIVIKGKDSTLRTFFPFAWWITSKSYSANGVLPLWFWAGNDRGTESLLWTPLSYYDRDKKSTRFHIGPLGLPFYATVETPTRSFSRRFLVSHDRQWASSANKPNGPLINNEWGVGFGLLWKWRERTVDSISSYEKITGVEWSFLSDLLAHGESVRSSRFYEFSDKLELLPSKRVTEVSRTRTNAFGWLLWRSTYKDIVTDGLPSKKRQWFTPLVSHSRTVNSKGIVSQSETGLLLDALAWKTADGSYDGSALLWGLLFGDEFYAILENRHRQTTLLPWGLLWSRDEGNFDVETDLLCGLLYDRERSIDGFLTETRLLRGLLYKSEKYRHSFGTSVLLGLLYDNVHEADTGKETFGILGWLYRSSRDADGTRERFALPGLSLVTHETNDDWAFSFLGGFFGLEQTGEETDWHFLWFL